MASFPALPFILRQARTVKSSRAGLTLARVGWPGSRDASDDSATKRRAVYSCGDLGMGARELPADPGDVGADLVGGRHATTLFHAGPTTAPHTGRSRD